MPSIVNILVLCIAAALTLYLIKKGVNLGLIMIADSVFVVFLTGLSPAQGLKYAWNGFFSYDTLQLVIIMFFIMIVENITRNTGMIKGIVDSLKELVGSNRLISALLPTALGLLPSPGGARFSCPMVEEAAGSSTNELNKAFINYWYRHVWIDAFILYPGIIVASKIIGVSVITLFLYILPFMLVNAVIGVIFGLRGIKKEVAPRTRPVPESLKQLFMSLLPVSSLILIYILLLRHTDYALEIASIIVSLAMLVLKRYNLKQTLQVMKEAFPVKLIFIMVGVMIFKEVLLESGAVDGLPVFLKSHGIPAGILFIILPFIGGFSSGIAVSFVSMTFPILLPLGMSDNLWYAAVAYVAGSIGSMMSPLHLCAVMSADYFKVLVSRLLTKTALAELTLLAVAVLVLLLLSL